MKNKFSPLNLQFFASPSSETEELIEKGSVHTGGNYGADGLLAPADAEKFLLMINDDSSFLHELGKETVSRIQGSISKLGVGGRLLRDYTEGEDNISGHEVEPFIGSVSYLCRRMTLGTSITEAWIQQNKSKANFESLFLGEIAKQLKLDILDMAFNGDENITSTDPDYGFLHLNDGFIKQIKKGGNVVDGATISDGHFSKKMFYDLRRAIPKKYRNGKFRWICSDNTYTDLCEYLSDRPTSLGDIAITKADGNITILQTEFKIVPNMPDDVIIYADPQNLTVVYFGEIRHRKADVGKEAIYKDERYYAEHMCIDYIIKEVAATAILINRGALA